MRPKKENVEARAERLTRYCRTRPFIWKNKTQADKIFSNITNEITKEEERKKFEQALKDYSCIRNFKYTGRLDIEIELALIDVGVFRQEELQKIIDKKIKNISKKYDIDKKTAQLISEEFGDITFFEKEYINYFLKKGEVKNSETIEKYLKPLEGKIVTMFDLSNPNFIFPENNYTKFNKIDKYNVFYEGKQIKEKTEERFNNLKPRAVEMIRMYYGLDRNKYTNLTLIGKEFNISKQSASATMIKALEKYRKMGPVMDEIEIVENPETSSAIIQALFKQQGIWTVNYKENSLEPEKYQDLMKQALSERSKVEAKNTNNGYTKEDDLILDRINVLKNTIELLIKYALKLDHLEEIKTNKQLLERLESINNTISEMGINYISEITDTELLKKIIIELQTIETRIKPIEELGLSPRSYNVLKREGIDTIGHLMTKNDDELINARNLGPYVFNEIKTKMKEKGLNLDDEEPNLDLQFENVIKEVEEAYQKLSLKDKEYTTKLEEIEEIIQESQLKSVGINKKIEELLDFFRNSKVSHTELELKYQDLQQLFDEEKKQRVIGKEKTVQKDAICSEKPEIEFRKDNLKSRLNDLLEER